MTAGWPKQCNGYPCYGCIHVNSVWWYKNIFKKLCFIMKCLLLLIMMWHCYLRLHFYYYRSIRFRTFMDLAILMIHSQNRWSFVWKVYHYAPSKAAAIENTVSSPTFDLNNFQMSAVMTVLEMNCNTGVKRGHAIMGFIF